MATQVAALKTMLEAESVQKQFYNALKENKDAFIASVIELYSGDTTLQACQPAAVLQEALKAAALNLPISKSLGLAYIVTYNTSKRDVNGQWVKVPTPTFLVGYRGLMQLAIRSGEYKIINSDVVYKGELRSKDKLTGEIDVNGERESDEVIGYFAHFELNKGLKRTLYMSVAEMAAYAKRYSASVGRNTTIEQLKDKANNPSAGKAVGWEGDFTAMALKTVTKRLLSKYGLLSVGMASAAEGEAKAEDAATDNRTEIVSTTAATEINLDEPATYEEITAIASESTASFEAPKVAAPAAQPQEQPAEKKWVNPTPNTMQATATAAPQADMFDAEEPPY